MEKSNTKLIVIIVVSVFLFLAALVTAGGYFFLQTFKNADTYQLSIKFIEQSELVKEKLGNIKGYGFFPMGNIELKNGEGKASFTIKVEGEKAEGKVKTYFYKNETGWMMSEANLHVGQEILPLLPLHLASMTFHKDGDNGPVIPEPVYELGDTMYWTMVIESAYLRNGKVSVKEGLKITKDNGQVVYENPDVVLINEEVKDGVIYLNNQIDLAETGKYTVRSTVTDLFSNRVLEKDIPFTVLENKGLKITNFVYRNEGGEGAINNEAIYKLGDMVFVTFDVHGLNVVGGRINFIEDMTVYNEEGEVMLDKPKILVMNNPWVQNDVLMVTNNIDVPDPGTYNLKLVVTDLHTGEKKINQSQFEVK